jgi:hypothetical protein
MMSRVAVMLGCIALGLVPISCSSRSSGTGAVAGSNSDDSVTGSYHLELRDASLKYPPLYVDRDWATVTQELDEKKLAVVESWDNGSAIHRYYLLEEGAFHLANGQAFDLVLQVSASNTEEGRLPVKPAKVYSANAALVANVNMPYRHLLKEEWIQSGTVLDVVLRSDEVKQKGERWPWVRRVSVYYGYIFDRWMETSPSGFFVTVEFAASLAQEVGGMKLYFNVPSGLDPWRSSDAKRVDDSSFVAKDTLGELQHGGANEWWQGEPDVIRENQIKFLGHTR